MNAYDTRPLHTQIIVVAGASSGMGKATALAVARAGATVVIAGRRVDALEAVRTQIVSDGGSADAVPTDATDQTAVTALLATTVERYGRVDGLSMPSARTSKLAPSVNSLRTVGMRWLPPTYRRHSI